MEAVSIKNFAKKPAKGGIPAKEKNKTRRAIAFDLLWVFKPDKSVINFNSPELFLNVSKIEKTPKLVTK